MLNKVVFFLQLIALAVGEVMYQCDMVYPCLTQFILRKFNFKDMLATENVFLVVVHVDE